MALAPHKFREIVLQLLYSQDLGHSIEADNVYLISNELEISKKNVREAHEKVHQILQHLTELDDQIRSVSTSYDFPRIQIVTRNILRLALFELFFDKQLSPKIIISEAIRLSRKFSTPESAAFVHALLDHLYQASLGEQTNLQILEQQSKLMDQSEQKNAQAAQEKEEHS